MKAWSAGDLDTAEQLWQQLADRDDSTFIPWYNLACARSRAGYAYGALKALRGAVASGYGADPSQVSWAHRDRDLEPVRKLRGFEELFGVPYRR